MNTTIYLSVESRLFVNQLLEQFGPLGLPLLKRLDG